MLYVACPTYHFSRARWLWSSFPLGQSIMPSTSPSASCQSSSSSLPHFRSQRTHGLLVQSIQPQPYRRWRLLRSGADFVDGVERMAKDSICVSLCQHVCIQNLRRDRCKHIPTESDIARVNGAPPHEGSVALIGKRSLYGRI